MDRLAQGMTDNPRDDADFTNPGAVKHLYQFVQTLKLGPAHLVGHSSGGGIVFYLALEHPELVKTLTIVSGGPQMPSAGAGRSRFDAMLEKCPPDPTSYEHLNCRLLALAHAPDTFPADYRAADEFMGHLPKAAETRRRMASMRAAHPGWPESVNDAYRERALAKAREGALQVPILIFAGKQDTLSWDADDPHAMMERELGFFDVIGAANRQVKMVLINEAGHFPYREHPDEFNAEVTQFIEYWTRPPVAAPASTGTSRPGVSKTGAIEGLEANAASRARAWEQARRGVLQMPILIYAAKQDTLAWDADDPHAMMRGELGFFDLVGTKNARVKMIVVNDAGHFPYREHPELFNADLVHFIDFWNNRR